MRWSVSIMEMVLKNNESALPKEKRHYLTYSRDLLAPCELKQDEDAFTLRFALDGTEPFTAVHQKTHVEKLRALMNCFELSQLRQEYAFALTPGNLVVDMNLRPRVILRDAPDGADTFVDEYKALIAAVLYPRYSYEDYYLGGKDLYAKNARLQQVRQASSAEELRALLTEWYQKEKERVESSVLLVSKKRAMASRILLPVLAAAVVALCVKGFFVLFRELPLEEKLRAGNNAYVAEDYVGVQNALSPVASESLPMTEKYILARSYVVTESLTSEQKEHILSGVTLKSDERVLLYWIELGRLEFQKAADYAKRLGDDELLLFALIKQSSSVKSDASLTGEEKAKSIEELGAQIKELQEALEKEAGQAQDA